jgi:PAS domain S-box-containing protein
MTTQAIQPTDSIAQLLDNLNCGASLIDRDGKVLHVNQRLAAMMGRRCDELVNTNVADLYADESDRQRVRKSLDRFGESSEMEFFLPLHDGKRLEIISSARPFGEHRLVTMIDISRQKQAERSLQEQYEHMRQLSDTLLQQALELKHYSRTLEQRVCERTKQLNDAHMEAIYMLAVASEAKDQDTGRHVRRIQKLARELSLRLGFSQTDADDIGHSAILHDVGKIHVADEILTKPGPLDDRERARMQLHTLAGERILSESSFFDRARAIARSHHENFDGSGYPDGLSKEQIPVAARIVHLADVYDALTHDRVYKKAWPRERAAAEIHAARGTMFDPEVVQAFDAVASNGG